MNRMVFKNYNGNYQLRIQNAQDLENIQTLDESHWVATSVPIDSLNCDRAFVSYVDTDHNGRIRTDELKAAQAWLFRFLANRERLGSDVLKLTDINSNDLEGQKVRDAAELILNNLNSPNTQEIRLSQVRDMQKIMANGVNNGDGIIPTEGEGIEADVAQFITVVMETIGQAVDASGKPGITQEHIDKFFQEAKAYLDWKAKGDIPEGNEKTDIMVWGEGTSEAYEIITALEEKIEQYFMQCATVEFDEEAHQKIKTYKEELVKIDFTNRLTMEAWLKNAPLASPRPDDILNLEGKINPLYKNYISDLRLKVLKTAFGKPQKQLTREEWNKIKEIFLPYRRWLGSKQGAKLENLGVDKIKTFLDGSYKEKLNQLIAKDKAVAEELEQIHNVEKLILYQRWLMELANNSVSFPRLYDPDCHSLFEMGTLVIDGRELSFTVKIKDRQGHKNVAKNSYMYLLYVEVTSRQDKQDRFEIVTAVTSGDADGLRIGKRGVFFTIDGKEWDAEVVDIVVNPISLWESIKAPFQQLASFIGKQIERFSTARYAELETRLDKGITDLGKLTKPGTTPTSNAASAGMRDILLGGGIAIAALGSAFAYITSALSKVKIIHILVALLGIAAVIIIPSTLMGFFRLRRRDMSTILEASGWAINWRMRLTGRLGRLFTRILPLPKNARKERQDIVMLFAKKFGYRSFSLRRILIAVLISIFILGLISFVIIYYAY